jgi:SAM-dependent methyltransferase
MGICCGNLLLLKAYADAASVGPEGFGDLVMYGRLGLKLSPGERKRLSRHQRLPAELLTGEETEPLLKHLGAKSVTSIDVSDYEGCDIVLDLMEDIAARPDLSERLVGKFDTVLDYGTSEHVFNFPQTLVNTWNMLREGGRYVFDLPVNGWTHHGLYQFSPNYFHSVGTGDYFALEHVFYHRRHGDRVDAIERFTSLSRGAIAGRKKVAAWGVFRKTRPAGMSGPLSLSALRVMQSNVGKDPGGQGTNRTYNAASIAGAFARRA